MPGFLSNRISEAIAEPDTKIVRLRWANCEETCAEFGQLASKPIFAGFNDPAFFQAVQIADEGRILTWPGDLEFDADALWFEAHPEDLRPGDAMDRAS